MKHTVPKPVIALDVRGLGVQIEGEFTRWSAVLVHRQEDSNLVTVGLVVRADTGLEPPHGPRADEDSPREQLFGFSSSKIERVADSALLATGLFRSEENNPQPLRLALELRDEDWEETLAISFATALEEHSRRWWQLLVEDNLLAALQLFPLGGRIN